MGWECLFCSILLVKASFISDSADQTISAISGAEKSAYAGVHCLWSARGAQPAHKSVKQSDNSLHLVS